MEMQAVWGGGVAVCPSLEPLLGWVQIKTILRTEVLIKFEHFRKAAL